MRVNSFSVSLDGYGAGPRQSLQEPLGVGGETLHRWMIGTRTFRQLFGNEGGSTVSTTNSRSAASRTSAHGSWAATCSAPCAARGPTTVGTDGGANNPPYHCDVFVLTHNRASRSRWRAARRSTSSRAASRKR